MWSQKKGEGTQRCTKTLPVYFQCCCYQKSNNDRLLKADFNVLLHDNLIKDPCYPTMRSLGILEVAEQVSHPVVRFGRH